jgi:signal transduction histidine kinase
MSSQSPRELTSRHNIVLVRWVLIIATSYLLLFAQPSGAVSARVGLFVAAYLASNLALSGLLPRLYSRRRFDIAVVLFDTVAVSIAILLTRDSGSDLFPIYFLVVFLGALTQRLTLLVAAAVLISVVHLSTILQFVSLHDLLINGYVLRIPFLLAVALFLGYEVEGTYRRERAAAAAARKRRRIDFLSAVTHDLKNPLGVIQSLAELLLDGSAGALTPEQAALTRRIHASAAHVLQLAVNSLDATRLRSGYLSLLRTPANLADIVERVVSRSRTASDLKSIALRWSADPPPPVVAIDVLQMERVVANLVDNAIKYTPPGGTVTVTLSTFPGQLVLDVRDNGPGIPPAELPAIFGKYRRRAATIGIDGSGLGLFIVKGIVEAHGGSVAAQSTEGAGTCITVRLPTAQTDRRATVPDVTSPTSRRCWRLLWS